MSYVGDFDPAGFDGDDPLTWPMPSPYSPGDWWYITAAGSIDGVPVDVGDRVYPVGTGRLYGELDFGDDVYGGGVPSPPWPGDPMRVRWTVTTNSAPAWDRPPPPYAGCPLIAGWRVVVEALYLADDDARAYGMLTYGDGVYGSDNGLGEEWVDVTPASFGLVIRRGGTDGSPILDVESLQADLRDLDASLFPMLPTAQTTDGIVRAPGVATPIRVSILDSLGNPYPLFAGRIEMVGDEHDRSVRLVTLDAFGFVSDLATTVTNYSRLAEETAEARLRDLLALSSWAWGVATFPSPGETLRRIEAVDQVEIRSEADRAAISTSWSVGTDRYGRFEVREWPFIPSAGVLEVTDQKGVSGLPSPQITYVADTAELLNAAVATSEEVQGSAEIVSESTDPSAIARFGRASEALGFPMSGLSAKSSALDTLVGNAAARYSRVVNRVESVEADSTLDVRWVETLANIDLGQHVRTIRTLPTPLVLDHVLVGIEHRLLRGRWTATLFLSTLTETI